MSEKEHTYQKKRSLGWDEKKRQLGSEKKEGKADEAPRFDLSSVEDERKAKFFKILFFAIFFNVLNLLCIGNLHQELKQLEKETDTTILTEYPGFFKAVQALFAFNLIQLIFIALLTYSTLKLQLIPFRVILVLTGLILFGKFISSISYVTAEKGVQQEFKEKILEINDSEVDSCLDDDAFKCRTIFTWNFSYYETIIDLIFGTVFSIAMMYNQKKEKDELIKQALRVAPSAAENEKDIERVKPDKKLNSEVQDDPNNNTINNQAEHPKLKKADNVYQRKRGNKGHKLNAEMIANEDQNQSSVQENQNFTSPEKGAATDLENQNDKSLQESHPEKRQSQVNKIVNIDDEDDDANHQRLNEQLNSINNETQQNENILQLNESMNDSKILMKNQFESSQNFSAEKSLHISENPHAEQIQPIKAQNLRGRKQIKKIKILQEKVLDDLDQNDEQ